MESNSDLSYGSLENLAKRRINEFYRQNTYNRIDDSRQPLDINISDSQNQDKYLEVYDKYDINLQILLDIFPNLVEDLKASLEDLVERNANIIIQEPEDLKDLDVSNHWTDDIKKKLDQDIHNSRLNRLNMIINKPTGKIISNSLMLKLVEVSTKAIQQGKHLFRFSEKMLSVHDMTDEYLRKFKKLQEELEEYQDDFFNDIDISSLFSKLDDSPKSKKIKSVFTDSVGRSLKIIEEVYDEITNDLDRLIRMNNDVILQHDNVVGSTSVVINDDNVIDGGYSRKMPVRFM